MNAAENLSVSSFLGFGLEESAKGKNKPTVRLALVDEFFARLCGLKGTGSAQCRTIFLAQIFDWATGGKSQCFSGHRDHESTFERQVKKRRAKNSICSEDTHEGLEKQWR
jgi:hypothetical protein